MDKKLASKNIRMGLILTGVLFLMAGMAWLWTVMFLAFATTNG